MLTKELRPAVAAAFDGAILFLLLVAAAGAAVATARSDAAPTSTAETHRGVPVGFTAEGHAYLGSPDAPVTMEEFSDYLCPFCERYYRQTLPGLLEKYGRSGKVRFVFRDFPIESLHPQAPAAAEAALCAGEQGAAKFWAMHDRLFESRARWTATTSSQPLLSELAAAAGVDVPRYDECVKSGRMKARIDESIAAGEALGFNGTPSFRFTSRQSGDTYTLSGAHPIGKFTEWIDALLSGKAPPAPPVAAEAKLPYWASPEGLAPDPQRPGFTIAGDAYKGNSKADLAIVEFSDFQCASCQRHALETQPVLDRQFVATGKVYWIFKNLPLAIHANAPAAAAAAECAGEQNRFWEMQQLLFTHSKAWSEGNPDPAILSLARDAGLSEAEFHACFEGRQSLERVLKDLYDSRGVATTTPTFILIQGGRGRVITGAQQADTFVKIIEQALSRPPAKSESGGNANGGPAPRE